MILPKVILANSWRGNFLGVEFGKVLKVQGVGPPVVRFMCGGRVSNSILSVLRALRGIYPSVSEDDPIRQEFLNRHVRIAEEKAVRERCKVLMSQGASKTQEELGELDALCDYLGRVGRTSTANTLEEFAYYRRLEIELAEDLARMEIEQAEDVVLMDDTIILSWRT